VWRSTIEKLGKNETVVEEKDRVWTIAKTAIGKVDDGIDRKQQVGLKLRLRDNGYEYIEWFTVYDRK
jgi:hypothetical protein